MKNIRNILGILFLTVLLLGVPKFAGFIASLFDYTIIDPDGSFAWISVHHIVQALIFLIIMVGLNRFLSLEFGFSWGDKKTGRKYLFLFVIIFSFYTIFMYTMAILTDSFQPFNYPLTATNIWGQLGFQLLLSGPSEELIFRAFAMTMLALLIKGRIFKGKISFSNLIAAIIFGLAHMSFSFAPFELSYSLHQVLYAIGLGLFYGDCFEKTKSMYYPMIMHSFTNVMMVGFGIILSFILST